MIQKDSDDNPTIPERLVLKVSRLLKLSLKYKSAPSTFPEVDKLLKEYDSDVKPLYDLFSTYVSKNRNLQVWQKNRLYKYYVESIVYKILIINQYFRESSVVLDEGIVHNGGFYKTMHHDLLLRASESDIFPSAVIFFKLSKNEYISRIEARFNENRERKINSLMIDVSREALERYVDRALLRSDEKRDAWLALDLPFVELEPHLTEDRTNEALRFINNVFTQA